MSVTRPFIWVCNICEKVENKLGYGLPSNWIWYGGTVREPEVKHKCGDCVGMEGTK